MCASERAVDGKFLTHRRTLALVGGGATAALASATTTAAITTIPTEKKFPTLFVASKRMSFLLAAAAAAADDDDDIDACSLTHMRSCGNYESSAWKLCQNTQNFICRYLVRSRLDSILDAFVCVVCFNFMWFLVVCVSFCHRIVSIFVHHSWWLCATVWDGSLCSHSPNWKFSCRTLAARFYIIWNCEICRRKLVECFGDQIFRTQLDMSSVLGSGSNSDSHQ